MNPDGTVLRISVRELVDFVLQSGDLTSTFIGPGRALAGTRGHQKIQKSRPKTYQAEVPVTFVFQTPALNLELRGRIDGIWRTETGVTIDEIKTTTLPLTEISPETQPLHWGQAKVYAFIHASQNNLDRIGVQLTYLQLDSQEIMETRIEFSLIELEAFFQDLVCRYLEWAVEIQAWHRVRDDSIAELAFPFRQYREGQRKLAVAVYRAIAMGRKLFVQAPTGIGKTIATLFPALKALGKGKAAKIFYLTAKTVGRGVAEQTLAGLGQAGLRCKTLTLTAKEKICFLPKPDCRPEACEFARGFFDRVKSALLNIFAADTFDRAAIENAARESRVCPFEFSLFLSLWADVIICDYNYAFDPRVFLRRFFDPPEDEYVFLVDEAHNMPDRGREMFSADVNKDEFADLRQLVKVGYPGLARVVGKITACFTRLAKTRSAASETAGDPTVFPAMLPSATDPEGATLFPEPPDELVQALRKLQKSAEAHLTAMELSPTREALLEVYFRVSAFLRVAEGFDPNFVCYLEKIPSGKRRENVRIRLFCLDPAELLRAALKRARSTVFFSATLIPLAYFSRLLGGTPEDWRLSLTSPFSSHQLGLMIVPWIRTAFKVRDQSFEAIAELIQATVSCRSGNYLISFPSFRYLSSVRDIFVARYPDRTIIEQRTGMAEEERDAFLRRFSHDNPETLIGFVVMGGIFGEGIDLRGDRLIGSIIIGVGLPQICLERDLIRGLFQRKSGSGFDVAYRFPGMTRVMQAAGRVIRTEQDRGVVILVDERFQQTSYRGLFPAEWRHAVTLRRAAGESTGERSREANSSLETLRQALVQFWGGSSETT